MEGGIGWQDTLCSCKRNLFGVGTKGEKVANLLRHFCVLGTEIGPFTHLTILENCY